MNVGSRDLGLIRNGASFVDAPMLTEMPSCA